MSSPPDIAPTRNGPDVLSEVTGGARAPLSRTRPGIDTAHGRALLWTCLAIVYVVWGSTYLGIRIAVEAVPPLLGAALRFGAAAVLLGALLAARRGGPRALRVSGRQLGGAALVGALLIAGGNGLVVVAESLGVPSGIAALLIATVPLIVVVLRLATGDRPRLATLIGVG